MPGRILPKMRFVPIFMSGGDACVMGCFVSPGVYLVGAGVSKSVEPGRARLGVRRRCRAGAEGAWERNPFCWRNEKGLGGLAPGLPGGRHTSPVYLEDYHGSISDVKRKRWCFLVGGDLSGRGAYAHAKAPSSPRGGLAGGEHGRRDESAGQCDPSHWNLCGSLGGLLRPPCRILKSISAEC